MKCCYKEGDVVGLFGPSWTWEEIQRKNAIVHEIQKENDRVLNQQRKMLEKYDYSGGEGTSIFGGIIGFIIAIMAIPFIIWLSFEMVGFLLRALSFGEGDVMTYEITSMIVVSILIWIIATLGITFSEKIEFNSLFKIYGGTFGATAILCYISVLVVDIIFNHPFTSIWKILQFLLAIFLTIFTSILWAIPFTIIGIVVSTLAGLVLRTIIKFIRIKLKKNKIENSNLYKKIKEQVNNETNNIYISNTSIGIEKSEGKCEVITFSNEKYSDLDNIGVQAISELLRKDNPFFNIIKDYGEILLVNKEYQNKKKQEERQRKKQQKDKIKEEKKAQKSKTKEGNDW